MSTNIEKELETVIPVGKKVTICNEEFFIKPFVLRNRIKILQLVTEIVGEMSSKIPNIQRSSQTVILTTLIGIAGERLVGVYEVVLGKDKEWLLENIQIKDELNIVQAIIEVNDFPLLWSQISQMMEAGK